MISAIVKMFLKILIVWRLSSSYCNRPYIAIDGRHWASKSSNESRVRTLISFDVHKFSYMQQHSNNCVCVCKSCFFCFFFLKEETHIRTEYSRQSDADLSASKTVQCSPFAHKKRKTCFVILLFLFRYMCQSIHYAATCNCGQNVVL